MITDYLYVIQTNPLKVADGISWIPIQALTNIASSVNSQCFLSSFHHYGNMSHVYITTPKRFGRQQMREHCRKLPTLFIFSMNLVTIYWNKTCNNRKQIHPLTPAWKRSNKTCESLLWFEANASCVKHRTLPMMLQTVKLLTRNWYSAFIIFWFWAQRMTWLSWVHKIFKNAWVKNIANTMFEEKVAGFDGMHSYNSAK